MQALGCSLSSELHSPRQLVDQARQVEQSGFDFALVSDHYHPWVSAQGQASFVWSVLGAVAGATDRLRVGTGVTCPLIRMHPAIIAHAAATTATLFDGRFFLGLGAGENLNEHILGDRWPPPAERHEMLVEAIDIIRRRRRRTSFWRRRARSRRSSRPMPATGSSAWRRTSRC